jgi:2-hydroxychromene-2-carboxylate isomerase
MAAVDFYFDYLSPYAYLAWRKIRGVCQRYGAALRPRPVLFAGLLNSWGQLGPAEIPPKAMYVFKDALRVAALEGEPFSMPKFHPFTPLTALRVSLPEVSGDDQERAIDALFSAGWGRGGDLGDPKEIAEALSGAGLDGEALVARTADPAVKEALKRSTDEAVAEGVFGIPPMIADGELFWGSDRLHHLALFLEGKDPLDRERAADILGRYQGAAVTRRRPAR